MVRDPRLDGTIVFTERKTNGQLSTSAGDTYPYVSDLANSSPTPDRGSAEMYSVYMICSTGKSWNEYSVVEQLTWLQPDKKHTDFEGNKVPRGSHW